MRQPIFRTIPKGFSLIEIVLALGIMSFALVGILGLFPIALDTATESKAETRIGLIAQSISAEISSTLITETDDTTNPPSVTSTALMDVAGTPIAFDMLSSNADAYMSFSEEGMPDSVITSGEFESGIAGTTFLARVQAEYEPSGFLGLNRLEIQVDYPGSAPLQNRKSYLFVQLIRP